MPTRQDRQSTWLVDRDDLLILIQDVESSWRIWFLPRLPLIRQSLSSHKLLVYRHTLSIHQHPTRFDSSSPFPLRRMRIPTRVEREQRLSLPVRINGVDVSVTLVQVSPLRGQSVSRVSPHPRQFCARQFIDIHNDALRNDLCKNKLRRQPRLVFGLSTGLPLVWRKPRKGRL